MKYYQNAISFIKKNKFHSIAIFLVICVALFLRLYKIGGYHAFLGDEGRDVRVVRDLLKGNLVFIGPQTSIGNMYLGPLYYYMMAPFLFLSNLNPIGPAIMNALLGTLTVFMVWYVGRKWFCRFAGLIAALLFAISPVAITYSRSSWNPNPMPLFALLSMWGIYQVWEKKQYHWIIGAAISLAFALQMHYLGLLLIPVLAIFWGLTLKEIKTDKKEKKIFLKKTLWAILAFVILMSPLVLFDLKHDFMNFNAFKTFFSNRQTTININPINSNRFFPVWQKIIDDLALGSAGVNLAFVSVSIFLLSLWTFSQTRQKKVSLFLFSWILVGVLGLALYKQHVYAHYFGFLFPAIYLLIGWGLSELFLASFAHKLLGAFSLIWLVIINFQNSPLKWEPNRQAWRTEAVANQIIEASGGESFNLGLIAKQNYDESYSYFLENKNASLVRGEDGITNQLFVICEDDKCEPEGHPQWQIAIFGPADTMTQWQIDYIKIFKLVHQEEE